MYTFKVIISVLICLTIAILGYGYTTAEKSGKTGIIMIYLAVLYMISMLGMWIK